MVKLTEYLTKEELEEMERERMSRLMRKEAARANVDTIRESADTGYRPSLGARLRRGVDRYGKARRRVEKAASAVSGTARRMQPVAERMQSAAYGTGGKKARKPGPSRRVRYRGDPAFQLMFGHMSRQPARRKKKVRRDSRRGGSVFGDDAVSRAVFG